MRAPNIQGLSFFSLIHSHGASSLLPSHFLCSRACSLSSWSLHRGLCPPHPASPNPLGSTLGERRERRQERLARQPLELVINLSEVFSPGAHQRNPGMGTVCRRWGVCRQVCYLKKPENQCPEKVHEARPVVLLNRDQLLHPMGLGMRKLLFIFLLI